MSENKSDLSDERGFMYLYHYKEKEYKICEIKNQHARGGDIHFLGDQFDVVLYGKIKLLTYVNGIDQEKILNENELVVIPKGVPHIFIALKNSLLIEWRNGPYEKTFYEPYRKLCEEVKNEN